MQNNLKNRPKLGNYPDMATKKELREYVEKICDFLSDLEEELQEKMALARRFSDLSNMALAEFACVREILGEA